MTRAIQFSSAVIVLIPLLAVANDKDKKHEESVKKAVVSSEAWLALVDQGQYGDSWESASTYLKTAVTKEEFEKSLTSVRKPLGNLKSREMTSKEYKTALPGAPDGEYVVIQFAASFANKKSATETITPMLDKDGAWRVSGYFIK